MRRKTVITFAVVSFLHLLLCKGLSSQLNNPDNLYKCVEYPRDVTEFHYSGTALGGWMVLEPWITPSLFYQFLGRTAIHKENTPNFLGMDSHTFCTSLGAEEANRQLRIHWKTWVTEEHIEHLASIGVDTLRVPVGDWMYQPYEPFIGCWDGAVEILDEVMEMCGKHNISVLLDIHGMRGSQNGYDNSGQAQNVVWNTSQSPAYTSFDHWNVRAAHWAGSYDLESGAYTSINYQNLNFSITVVETVVNKYMNNPVVVGLEPANEPWAQIPIDVVKKYYWESYNIVRSSAPKWITLFHDSFRFDLATWSQFAEGCPNWAIDTHIYQAWDPVGSPNAFQVNACETAASIAAMEAVGVPVIVGEWSLATDNCAMWLNGFQDNLPGYPFITCPTVACPTSYMQASSANGDDVEFSKLDASWGPEITQDPRGTGASFIDYGQCPIDDTSWSDNDLHTLALAKLFAFDFSNHGQFFWNFRTELEPRWSYIESTRKGWLPKGPFAVSTQDDLFNTCNALLNPPINCDDPIVNDDGWYNVICRFLTSPSVSIFSFVIVLVGLLFALKSCGGLSGKRNDDKKGPYTMIPDDGNMAQSSRLQVNTKIRQTVGAAVRSPNDSGNNRDDRGGGQSVYSSTRSADTVDSGVSAVEMVVDKVVMSDRSQWSTGSEMSISPQPSNVSTHSSL